FAAMGICSDFAGTCKPRSPWSKRTPAPMFAVRPFNAENRITRFVAGKERLRIVTNGTQPADLDSAGWPRASMDACRSRTNADNRLPLASLGPVKRCDGIVEGRDVADVRPQSSVPHPLDDLTQLGTIGLDNEIDRQAVGGPRLGRPDDGHQCSSGSNQACGP